MIDLTHIVFGRLPAQPSRLAAVAPHTLSEPPPPAECPRTEWQWTPTLADNIQLPTCTIAALANSLRSYALLHGFDIAEIVDQRLLDLYATLAGCAPTEAAIGATDGLVMLDVLEYVQVNGFNYGGQTGIPCQFRSLDPTDTDAVDDAIFRLGSVYAGVTLYAGDVVPGAAWQGKPVGAAVGGHCIAPFGWTLGGMRDATWGETLESDMPWWRSRADECYALTWDLAVA